MNNIILSNKWTDQNNLSLTECNQSESNINLGHEKIITILNLTKQLIINKIINWEHIIFLDWKAVGYYDYEQLNKNTILLKKLNTTNFNYWYGYEYVPDNIIDLQVFDWYEIEDKKIKNIWSSILYSFIKDMRNIKWITKLQLYIYDTAVDFYDKTLKIFKNNWFVKNYEIDQCWTYIEIDI